MAMLVLIWAGVLCLLTIFYVVTLLRLLHGFQRLKPGTNTIPYSVSVIVAARNEGETIGRCIKSLIQQDYPTHLTQIVIVDDGSTDGTVRVVEDFAASYSNIVLVKIKHRKPGISPKKWALTRGVAVANGDLLFFTDADCVPPSTWISEMVTYFEKEVGLVAGFSSLFDDKNGLLGKLIALDTIASAFVAAGGIGLGKAITCTGRNLAYRKSIFEEVKGYARIMHSVSGDDDLFLQIVKKKTSWKIRYAISPGSFVPSFQNKNLKEFYQQRKRHLSAGKYYTVPLKINYLLMHGTNWLLYLSVPAAAIFRPSVLDLSLVLLILKWILDFWVLRVSVVKFNKVKLIRYFPLWEIFFILCNTFIGPLALLGKIRWKD